MNIRPEEIESKKKVGKLDGNDVYEIGLIGGLYLLLEAKGRNLVPISVAPHSAILRHLAKKKTDGKIEFTDLSKSEAIDPRCFQDILPKYEAITDALRARWGK